uniref:Uncharacterized protein n=1 Tax=Anguilla anguilla TaxID=7936 RepID=A0A0E9TKR8_ANGAN
MRFPSDCSIYISTLPPAGPETALPHLTPCHLQ